MAEKKHGRVQFQFRAEDVETEKSGSVQQKKMELEREVEELGRKLDHEEKVHQVLKMALQPDNGPTPVFQSFLPRKTRELLEELVMVEAEITRLEAEIRKINEETQTLKSNQQGQANGRSTVPPNQTLVSSSIQVSPENKWNHNELMLETRSMFFINQAMRGDYDLHSLGSKTMVGCSEGENPKKKGRSKASKSQVKTTWKDEDLDKSSSHKLPPRHSSHSSSKSLRPANGASPNSVHKHFAIPHSSDKVSKKLQPNKLSETTMKCLICIFLRLMRTSRKAEQEKSSNEAFTGTGMSLRSRSFLGDDNDLKSAEPRVMKQQDPYDIFKIKESRVRDIGHYKNLVICTSSSLDMKTISTCTPLLRKLRVLLNSLQNVDLRFLTHNQKLAFWINMHNITIMNGFLEHGMPSSTGEVIAMRNKAALHFGGNKLNALAIEHFILKRPSSNLKNVIWKGEKDDNEDVDRNIHRLENPEPNITFALCCGNKSSPAVRIYTAENITAELEKAKLEYLQASVAVTSTEEVMIPQLLTWNMSDFAKDLGSLVQWICNQLPTSGSLRRSMVGCLRGLRNGRTSKIVDVLPFEFDFQLLLPI